MSEDYETDIVTSQHPQSRRTAIIDISGDSLWLYLTASDELRPIADCWLANRGTNDVTNPREAGLPPPAPEKVLRETASNQPLPAPYRLEWSQDGEAVRAIFDDCVVAFLRAQEKRGFNRHLSMDCPWGQTFDEELHDRLFS